MIAVAGAPVGRRGVGSDQARTLRRAGEIASDTGGTTLLVALAAAHGFVLLAWPTFPLMAIGMWWNANTISHTFIHRPFFRTRPANIAFSAYLTLALGVPQRLWRDRHLAHHRDVTWRLRWSWQLVGESVLLVALWLVLIRFAPGVFVSAYLPGIAIGLILCAIQGYYEHAHGTISHYGRFYNRLFLNDGYHAEHHANPGAHWTRLPDLAPANSAPASGEVRRADQASPWPPIVRWIDDVNIALEWLERVVLHSALLRRYILYTHRRAFRAVLNQLPAPRRVIIVGGGLFPRTALILKQLAPAAQLTIVDANAANLDRARQQLDDSVDLRHQHFNPSDDSFEDVDLLVIPLSFQGDRSAIYRRPAARAVLVHDWIWRRRRPNATVSLALLKCVNLVVRE